MLRYLTRQISSTSVLSTKPESINEIQTIVIGAGIAGLSAASHLINHGFTNTIILEATDRYGGRINSKYFGDVFCELGAKWITIDASKDSAYELIRQATGLKKQIQKRNDKIYISIKGEKVNQKFPDLMDFIFRKLCIGIELEKKYNAGVLYDLDNVQTYFQAETSKIIKSTFKNADQTLAHDIFSTLIKEFSSLMGCCLEYVNIEHITKMQSAKTSPIYIPTGMDNILGQITNNFDRGQLRVGNPVGSIEWSVSSDLPKKTVCCLDGSKFLADHIICTLPLGVLKTFSKYMFHPTLPKEKLDSIKHLGFGCPIKIYFEYEKHIRQWFQTNIRPVWSLQKRGKDWIWTKQIIEISKLPTSRKVLEVSVGGAYFEEIEKLPDSEILHEVTEILRKCLKNPSVPYPISLLRSSWSSSACFLGGQPYFSTRSTVCDVNTLAAPLGETLNLLFAGDATIINGFGSIDGARRSGLREAQRIIEYYNRQA